MVGRPISSFFPDPAPGHQASASPRLELRGAGNGYVDGIDLTLRGGEIVGVAGLQGSGRTELLEAVFGIDPFTRGEVLRRRRPLRPRTPRAGHPRRARPGHRGPQGHRPGAEPVPPRQRPRRGPCGLPAATGGARREVPGLLGSLAVAARSLSQEAQFLSGGNQQKVVLARWLTTDPASSCSTSRPAASTSAPSTRSTR